jgi:Spy/CpxP family protein refolding chaperone
VPNLSCVLIIHKENTMKRNHTIIAGLILAATVATTAYAQGRGCDGMGPMGMGPMSGPGGQAGQRGGMKFDPAQRAERHLGVMKNELKLTAEQEPLWQAYAEKMKSEAGKGFQARTQATDEKLSAPERMAKMEALMQERLAAMKGVHESFNRLYAGLTPEQKATADQFSARMGQGMKQKGGKPRGQGMGPGMGGPGSAAQKPQS